LDLLPVLQCSVSNNPTPPIPCCPLTSRSSVCRERAWFTDAYVPLINTVVSGGIELDVVGIGIVELEVHERLVLTTVLHVPSAVCNVFKLPLSRVANRILAIQSFNENPMESVMVDEEDGGRVIADFRAKSATGFLRLKLQSIPEGTQLGPYSFWKNEMDEPTFRWRQDDRKIAEAFFPKLCS
jgi:hypothetical protein